MLIEEILYEDENDILYKLGRGITRTLKGDPNWEPENRIPTNQWPDLKDLDGNPPSNDALRKLDQLTRDFADAAGISYDDALKIQQNPDEIGHGKVGRASSDMNYAGGRGEPTSYDVHQYNQKGFRAAQDAENSLRLEIPNWDDLDAGTQKQIRNQKAAQRSQDNADKLLKRGKYADQGTKPTKKIPQTTWAGDDPFPDPFEEDVSEDLRAWFGKGKKGGAGGGGWDRYNTKGERIGKCGDSKPSEGKPKCLSKSAAAKLRNADKDGDGKKDGKAGIARAVKRKKSKDSNRNRRGKAKNVKN